MTIKKNGKMIGFLMAVLLLAAGVTACGNPFQKEPAGSGILKPTSVDRLGTENRFPGIVVTSEETAIEKDASKEIDRIYVAVGDTVQKGQVLFTYSAVGAQEAWQAASAELEDMRISQQTNYDTRDALSGELYGVDEETAQYISLQIQELDLSIQELSTAITAKEEELKTLEAGLTGLEVVSPVDGRVQSINDMDRFGYGMGESTAFMTILKTDRYQVRAYINELNLADLQEGMEVVIRSRKDETKTWTGKVTAVDTKSPTSSQGYGDAAYSMNPVTSSRYPVSVSLDSEDGLILGQHVYVEVKGLELRYEELEEDEEMEDLEEAGPGSEMAGPGSGAQDSAAGPGQGPSGTGALGPGYDIPEEEAMHP